MARSFAGNQKYALDAKGRATIPNEYRAFLGDMFTIGMNSDFSSVELYPLESWEKIEAELAQIPRTDKKGRKYVRYVLGNAFPNSRMDAQGRVLIPQTLRDMVFTGRDIRFVGMGESLEIWDEARFMQENGRPQDEIGELSDYVCEKYYSKN